jgi:predicted methyltransferase MtxX (methanogen marker protein 4)
VAELYKDFRVDFVLDVLWGSREEDLSRWSEQRALEESEFVAKLASQILESIE